MKDPQRTKLRRLLKYWGAIAGICADMQCEIAEYDGLLAAAEGETKNADLAEAYRRRIMEVTREVQKLTALQGSLSAAVAALPVEQQKVLNFRYRKNYEWEKVARLMLYSRTTVRRFEAAAITALCQSVNFEASFCTLGWENRQFGSREEALA